LGGRSGSGDSRARFLPRVVMGCMSSYRGLILRTRFPVSLAPSSSLSSIISLALRCRSSLPPASRPIR
jgi:hypothetical protein